MSGSLLTEAAQATIVARIELGVPFRDAALAAGVRPETARSWLTRGRREHEGACAGFAAAVEDAREVARARPAVMDADELAGVVSDAARGGSVAAMKLRWEMLRAGSTDDEVEEVKQHDDDVLAEVDELARRRVG